MDKKNNSNRNKFSKKDYKDKKTVLKNDNKDSDYKKDFDDDSVNNDNKSTYKSYRDRGSSFKKNKKSSFNKDDKKKSYKKSFKDNDSSLKGDGERGSSFKKDYKNKNTDFKSKRTYNKNKSGNSYDKSIRLNRYIASAGICSRREADNYIKAGVIKVNGKVVNELGTKVLPTDNVTFNDQRIKSQNHVYVLLNKPKDYITTLDDPHAKKKITDLVRDCCRERIYPVGRLDRYTTGVLLLTNDGDLTKKLTHPKYNRRKIYEATLDKNLTRADMNKILTGIELDDGPVNADEIAYVDADNKKIIGIELHSGRNRIVRRIFEHLGYKVNKLDRVYFAGLTKKGLARGKWRFLTEKEVNFLKMGGHL